MGVELYNRHTLHYPSDFACLSPVLYNQRREKEHKGGHQKKTRQTGSPGSEPDNGGCPEKNPEAKGRAMGNKANARSSFHDTKLEWNPGSQQRGQPDRLGPDYLILSRPGVLVRRRPGSDHVGQPRAPMSLRKPRQDGQSPQCSVPRASPATRQCKGQVSVRCAQAGSECAGEVPS